jgi:hypothetical protein
VYAHPPGRGFAFPEGSRNERKLEDAILALIGIRNENPKLIKRVRTADAIGMPSASFVCAHAPRILLHIFGTGH